MGQANVDHIARHHVTPQEAEETIRNEPFDVNYEVIDGEERWTVLGHTHAVRVLILVWTMRGDAIRVITAREASPKATAAYLRARGML